MKRLTGPLMGVARGLGSAMLPNLERARYARIHDIDVPAWSFLVGMIQMLGGAGAFLFGGLAFMLAASDATSMALLENWFGGLSTTHFQGAGLLNWLAWFLNPLSWPFAYLALVGLARCVAFAVSREAIGDPLVTGALRLAQRAGARREERQWQRRLGPVRRDRIVDDPGADLVVLASREKQTWNEAATIEIDGRYYRVSSVEIRRDGDWEVLAYLLREQEPGRLVRRLVSYVPPVSGGPVLARSRASEPAGQDQGDDR